ncbi:MAG: aspartate--tRNA ligase [Planctomycetota bacterium]|nr:MAG: aspartate--tRNA ligase [Planctomycetota bacterium]
MTKRTHHCNQLTRQENDQNVTLIGWVQNIRKIGKILFFTLADKHGTTQIVVPDSNPNLLQIAQQLGYQYVVAVEGKVRLRPPKDVNLNMTTGEIEVVASQLHILSPCADPFPLSIDERDTVSEHVRMQYRYLDLRRPSMQEALRFRHNLCFCVREYFHQQGFLEVDTPLLTKSTPEGARDYLVPSRVHPGQFYALPQSPQMFKQLLMIGGVEKYFQIAKCFRDEDLRADRQPEFTQIDVEMSFVEPEDIFSTMEGMFATIFQRILQQPLSTPFPRIRYSEAIEKYGSDKPDLRLEIALQDLSYIAQNTNFRVFQNALQQKGVVKGICFPNAAQHYSRKKLDELATAIQDFQAKGLAWIKIQNQQPQSPIKKFFSPSQLKQLQTLFQANENALILIVADSPNVVHASLSYLRNRLAKELGLLDDQHFAFCWITDYPLFEYNPEEERLESLHHPFTSPHPNDLHLLEKDPLSARSLAYDLVLNGVELGSGSIRIHNPQIQEKIFQLLQLPQEEIQKRFGFFLKALQYGTPPHGGIALGLDRILMLLGGFESIREVIAFPKTATAACPMTGCPSEVSDQQLNELHISLKKG